MLVLNRKINEKVMVGDDIEVTYLGMENKQAKIGFSAPQKVPVHREEIYLRIKNKTLKKGDK